jgi:hypothetical protein
MNKYKERSIVFNNLWIVKIAIIVLIIIMPCHANSKWHSGSRTLKPDGRSDKKALLLSQDFESLDDISAAGGSYSGVSLVPGESGNGVKIDASGAYITYPTARHFNIQKGTLEFWVKPLFDMHVPPTNTAKQYLFDFQWGKNQHFSIMMAKIPAAPSQHAFWGLSVFFPPTNDPPRADFSSLEPYMFCRSMRPDVFSRFRAYWDFSLPNTDALSIYYSGSGTAYYSVNSTDGIVLSAPGVVKRIGYRSGYYSLGAWVSAINAVKGFHATLIGDPSAQGFMVNTRSTALPTTSETAAKFQQMNSYLILQANDVYSPVYWRNYLAPQALRSDATMGFGCQANRNYPGRVILDSLKVSNTVELPVIPFPQHFANPYFPKTMATYKSLFANDGFCSAHETHATQPTDCPVLGTDIAPGEDVIFFERGAFEWVLPNYVPAANEIKDNFTYHGTPLGEKETAFFNIYSRIALTNMELTYTPLTGPGTIAKANLDLRVVHNWWNGSHDGTVAETLPVYAPELMLHCDIFGEAIHGVKQVDPQLDPTIGGKVPVFLKLDHVHTKMAAYTAKNFGLIYKVPVDATPGNYTCTVTLTANELAEPMTITLNITVLPWALRDAKNVALPWLSVYNLYTLCNATPGLDDWWDSFKKCLKEMRDYGMDGVQIHAINDYADAYRSWGTAFMPESPHDGKGFIKPGGKPGNPVSQADLLKYWENVLRICHDVGMKMVCMYAATQPGRLNLDYTPELVDLMESFGFEPWLFGRDEYDQNQKSGTFIEQVAKAERIHEVGGKCLVDSWSGAFKSFDQYMEAKYPGHLGSDFLQGRIHIIGDAYMHDVILGVKQKKPQCYESYYFQTRTLYPNHERYWCGYFRYHTGFDGPQPTHAFALGWQDFGFTKDKPALTIPYGIIYIAVDQNNNLQFLPTLHGCAMREGFKDDKYLATWEYYKDKVAMTHPTQVADSQAVINKILTRYKEDYGHVVTPAMRNSATQFATDRKAVIREIITLKKLQNGRS